ncbi:ABC transporter permease [Romboutsia sp.]|uniref:ABC transporter permease n=1 Tax=Romboutsia sp. TaxID=1965302 RepID=UPI003F40EC27
MLRLTIRTLKLLSKKKSFIVMAIIVPAVITLMFSFAFGGNYSYKVGVMDKDNSYISKDIINTINKIDNIEVTNINEKDYKTLLISHQIEMAIIIDKGLQQRILEHQQDEVHIKSINNSDFKAILTLIVKSRIEELTLMARESNKDINKLKSINETYTKESPQYKLNLTNKEHISINNSIGIVIMIIFITGINITNFLIEDEENNTKARILASGIRPWKYYLSMFIVFYIISSVSSVIYYFMCIILNVSFNMQNSYNFLLIMLLINFTSVALSLLIVSFTSSRYIATTVNILLVVPSCMLSGLFWDFNVMPNYLQQIGNMIPLRWSYLCIELLQKHDNLIYVKSYIFGMILTSIAFLVLSIKRFMKNI